MTQDISSLLHEDRRFAPASDFVQTARLNAERLAALRQEAAQDYEAFWARLAREALLWETPFQNILNAKNAPHYRWFEDGRLNVSVNCIDRHLPDKAEHPAIVFEGERGDRRSLNYRDLYEAVGRCGNVLRRHGVKAGDRVVLYMPMIPEAVIAMQACARIGATHSVVFGGFSANALRDRIQDAGATFVITADGGFRGGRIIPLQQTVNEALAEGCATVQHVLVYQRTDTALKLNIGRDLDWAQEMQTASVRCEPEWVGSEHPLFLLYTSGSTGKPKGIQHASAGYLLGAIVSMQWVFDIQPDDVFWCTADVGWITGHSYVAYGPLANGCTVMMYEGAPTVPDAGRFWDLIQRYRVSIFYTAPTAIRALMKQGDDWPNSYDLSSLRLLGTVGEPINPEAWRWYADTIGKGRCPVVDTWWQTETGAHAMAPIPGAMDSKPGSCGMPLPGIDADVVDATGAQITDADRGGTLVIKRPWPSMLRTIWGDDQRYADTYWGQFDGRYYVAGDSARRDKDGYFWIMGRLDDVLNVSGHRLGTMEIESALVAHPAVVEAAVVGRPDALKGESVLAFVVLRHERPVAENAVAMTAELRQWVTQEIGAIARPDSIRFADNLPKTRSGKIMRRLLRTIGKGEPITQDTSTLENEAILQQLQDES